MNNLIVMVLLGTGFLFVMTSLGSAVVFFFKKDIKPSIQQSFLGFAGGVMVAASVWSLIMPSIEEASKSYRFPWLPAAIGFLLGGLFLYVLDRFLPHLHPGESHPEGVSSRLRRTTMLIFAVTLHNIPEGMAVGLAFALYARGSAPLAAAIALAVGIGIQNFPEGAAISLPLRQEGFSRKKAFLYGAATGIVEPIFGTLTVLIVDLAVGIMPWILAFAAGAMVYVTVEELIPHSQELHHSDAGTIGFMIGFALMMVLDVALG